MKQQIHVRIDSEIYLMLRAKHTNISGTVNKLLREYVEVEDDESSDILKLQDELEKVKQERENKTKELGVLAVKIAKMKEDKEKQEAENQEKRKALIESIKRSGVLNE